MWSMNWSSFVRIGSDSSRRGCVVASLLKPGYDHPSINRARFAPGLVSNVWLIVRIIVDGRQAPTVVK